jgi:hypothetical protein
MSHDEVRDAGMSHDEVRHAGARRDAVRDALARHARAGHDETLRPLRARAPVERSGMPTP